MKLIKLNWNKILFTSVIVTLTGLFLYCYYELSMHNSNDTEILVNNNGQDFEIYINDFHNEFITLDVVYVGEMEFEEMQISLISDVNIKYESNDGVTLYSGIFEIREIRERNISDSMKIKGRIRFDDIKLKLPSQLHSFPFSNYVVNLSIDIYDRDSIIETNGFRVINNINYMKIVASDNYIDFNSDVQKNKLNEKIKIEYIEKLFNGFSLKIGYFNSYKLLVLSVYIAIIILLIYVSYLGLKSKESNLTLLGTIIAVFLGLPTITSQIKFDFVSDFTVLDIFNTFFHIWILLLFVLLIFRSKKAS